MKIFNLFIIVCFLLSVRGNAQEITSGSWLTGDPADVTTKTKGGVALVGGGGNVDGAFKWMIDRSGGGDVVVIRATDSFLYNDDITRLGKVNSVETLLIGSRDVANDEKVAQKIRNAEMLFITGGDQSNYMNFWRNTKTEDAINYLMNKKKVPVGGTSAGCAVLSGFYYSGEKGSAATSAAMNPYDTLNTIYNNDFLQPPYLKNVITDQHYTARNRQIRHLTFMARIIKDWKIYPNGIAPDERTAVCIDEKGNAKVYGTGKAYFLTTNHSKPPEKCINGEPLQWLGDQKAVRVYSIQASANGNGNYSVADFDESKASGGQVDYWWVENGAWKSAKNAHRQYVMVIHGGAGTISKNSMTEEKEDAYRDALRQSLQTGYAALQSGKSSIDAVEAAIIVLEDNPLFNAGKGAVFTHDGRNELDASIMDGNSLAAGAVAGLHTVRNPISAAKAVMQKSEHVMMSGAGAEQFAKEAGLQLVEPGYFFTEERWKGLQQALKEDSLKSKLDHSKAGTINVDNKFGTVGCVALDKNGNLAAGTSTGGMTNKKYGRIGDSPIIGAGTYANKQVGVSCTGWGEYYIRSVAAYDLAAMMEYKKIPVDEAAKTVIQKIGKLGGDGGMIALDKKGNIAMTFNTEGMYRGAITSDGEIEIYIYKD